MIMTGCSRTMGLNQTAETLDKREKETTFKGGIGAQAHLHIPAMILNLGFQHRVGLKENFELQLLLESSLIICPPYPHIPSVYSNADLLFKFRVFKGKRTQVALIPYIGISQSFDSMKSQPDVGPTLGLKAIFSHHFKRAPEKRNLALFHGPTFEFNEQMILAPCFNAILGYSLGFELHKRIVSRHEFNFNAKLDTTSNHYNFSKDLNSFHVMYPTFTFTYTVMVGKRYKGTFKERRAEREKIKAERAGKREERRKERDEIDWSE